METLKQAFKDASRYDAYVYAKVNAQTDLIWAFLGLSGSLISYFVIVLGDQLQVDQSYIGWGIGALWIGIVGAGYLFTAYVSPHEIVSMQSKPTGSSFLWLAWFVAMGIGVFAEILAFQMGLVESNAILAVAVGLLFGNIANYLVVREKLMLLAPAFNLLTIIGILLIPYPYEMLVFGLGLWFPLYLSGFITLRIRIPKLLE